MWYMLYARGGHEFWVAEEIKARDIEVICEPRCVFKRVGKDRRATPHDQPYLPNYLFAAIPAERYLDVMQTKWLAKTTTPMGEGDMRQVRGFQAIAKEEYADAQRIIDSRAAVCEYSPGQAMRFLDGRFSDKMLTFRAIVEHAHDTHPRVVMETEMMGRMVRVEADPLDVKAG